MAEATVATTPFPSFGALRAAYEELFETVDANEGEDAGKIADKGKRIELFIRRAVATGAILDTAAERRIAQGFIDYWIASFYTSLGAYTQSNVEMGRGHLSRTSRLAPFETEAIEAAVNRGEAILMSLGKNRPSPFDRFLSYFRGPSCSGFQLVQRVLMQLIRVSEGDRRCITVPVKRKSLLNLGNPAEVQTLINRLLEAGIFKATSATDGDVIELPQALTRKWERLSHWAETRMKFREAALFWQQSGRDRGALLSAGLARSADETYADLNQLERDFLQKSKRRSREIFAEIFLAVAIVFLGVVFSDRLSEFIFELQRKFWVPLWIEGFNSKVKSDDLSGKDKSGAIRWLAKFDQALIFPSTLLKDVDLDGAILKRPNFAQARLVNAKFDRSEIDSGTFSGAVVANTSFKEASLIRARFDDATFCERVDFSNSNLHTASFRNVTFFGPPPIFENTAWWRADWDWEKDWDKIREMRKQDRSGLEESNALQQELAGLEASVRTAPTDSIILADALNRKSWTLALFGIKSKDVEETARMGLEVVDKRRKKGAGSAGDRLSSIESDLSDTLGYVLLQKGDAEHAVGYFENALRLREDSPHLFRTAIAQFQVGQKEKAMEALTKAMAKSITYLPSHELVLVQSQITGIFEEELFRLSRARKPSEDGPSDKKIDKCPL